LIELQSVTRRRTDELFFTFQVRYITLIRDEGDTKAMGLKIEAAFWTIHAQ